MLSSFVRQCPHYRPVQNKTPYRYLFCFSGLHRQPGSHFFMLHKYSRLPHRGQGQFSTCLTNIQAFFAHYDESFRRAYRSFCFVFRQIYKLYSLCFISNYNKSLPGNHPDRDLKEKRSFLCSWFPCLRFGAAGVPHTRLHSRPGFLFTLLW